MEGGEYRMDLGLKDKVAIVTGASRGLGFAAARTLAGEGAQFVMCSRNTHTLTAADFEDISDEQWITGFNLVLMSMIRFTRRVLPYMKKQRWGRVLTISSIAAKQPLADLVISSTLRPGIHALNKMLTGKYASYNILFNAVAPGFILTKRQEEIFKSRAAREKTSVYDQMESLVKEIPVRKMGTPDELAAAIAFLVSEKAGYISGATLSVDGGMTRGLF
jgi:3-oxoacyl-[acyl-carrier protein] reductase